MMLNKMDDLLKKYWEGETSIEEEKFIRTYFRGEEIDPAHEQYKSLFDFFDEETKIVYPGKITTDKNVRIKRNFPLIRIAAVFLAIIALSAIVYINIDNRSIHEPDWSQYEVEDPEEAKEMVIEALALVSGKLNKGENNMRENLKALNKLPIR